MTVKLHRKQQQIARSNKRFRVVNAARRSGKTFLAVEELVFAAVSKDNANVAYTAPTYSQAREICWEILLNRVRDIPGTKINETRLEVTVPNQYGTTSKITLKGWESIESLRGQAFDFMVLDEVAMYRNFNSHWQEIIRPTLADKKGKVLFISTPKGFNFWYDLYNKEKQDDDYESFHFTTYDNPFIPKEEVDKAREELSEDSFHQEYLADWRTISGLVCDWWDRGIHLKTWNADRWFLSVDGGFKDPLACLLIGMDHNDTVYVADGIRKAGMDTDEIELRIKDVIGDKDIIDGVIDSDNPRLEAELNERDIMVRGVEKQKGDSRTLDEELAKRMYQYGRVQDGMTKLYVNPDLSWLTEEIEMLQWKEKQDGESLPHWDDHRLGGHHYDGMRALSYFLLSFTDPIDTLGQQIPVEEKKNPMLYDPDEALLQRSNPWK